MKKLLLNNPIMNIWKEANSPLEYLIALWISGLAALAIGGWLTIVIKFIMDPSMFNGVSFGLIDYI